MPTRLCKIALVAAAALFHALVVLNNTVWDYGSNLAFVRHVLAMDTLFSGEAQAWRAWRGPVPGETWWVHHVAYAGIILWETVVTVLCTWGAWRLWRARQAPVAQFHAAKSMALLGLTVSLLLWFVAFITLGGEWFLMWQSATWNGQAAAFRMFACLGIVLLFVNQADEAA
jgi:predicted small integral membrane protein